ncbi:MAG: NnrU family protein [Pseudomonadales bacterium]
MLQMMIAALLFLGTHLGISSTGLRGRLVDRLGERGYLGLYSVLALLTLGYLIWLYGELPRYDYFWSPSPGLYMVPKLLMPLAAILALGGFLVRNPTTVGMEGSLRDGRGAQLGRGVTRITRHPFQWGVVIWAVSHLAANGDRVSVVFFGTFLILGLAGGALIDRKKARALGSDWQGYAAATSNVPFLAILSGRQQLALREQMVPVLVGLVGYALLYLGHQWIAGVRLV